ncbi:hypothetical protein BHE74_00010132 [Ensete ventricosum]|uniref:BHLH domain-containing protein n=1 Tax=Ensete ventricosum TaxID=4639 RepID=A0A445MFR1_ENSVE|nr:hypothetical protein BHE74_00010132 [Ensete ventricosum]RZR73127.1 hypothetical protein BHM03_00020540 [Ensete ventricosum]
MALEAAAFRQGLFGYACNEWCATGGGGGGASGSGFGGLLEAEKRMGGGADETWDPSSCSCSSSLAQHLQAKAGGRRKRRRAKSVKNREEVESQRMTHIAVERNRRRQMNDLKVLSRRRPKQLVELVVGLQSLRLMPLHLNVTSLDQMVLYAFSLKFVLISSEPATPGLDRQVEDDCQHTSVDEIATAVHQMLCGIQEEETLL